MASLPWRRKEIEKARRALEESKKERPAVLRIVKDLRVRREENNFAPSIEKLWRGATK